jgi:hypothetical protein
MLDSAQFVAGDRLFDEEPVLQATHPQPRAVKVDLVAPACVRKARQPRQILGFEGPMLSNLFRRPWTLHRSAPFSSEQITKPPSGRSSELGHFAQLRGHWAHHVVRNHAAGDIRIDREAMRVQCGGREVRLTATEFRLLECLVAHAGHILSRPQLRDRVWGHGADVSERTIDVNVGRLRRALSRAHESNPIRTVRDFGYSFVETDRLE